MSIRTIPVAATTRILPLMAKRCFYCHSEFMGTSQQDYCGRPCKSRAYYQRKQDREEAKSEQGKRKARTKYNRLRKAIVAEGTPMLTDEELRKEIRERTRR